MGESVRVFPEKLTERGGRPALNAGSNIPRADIKGERRNSTEYCFVPLFCFLANKMTSASFLAIIG